MRISFKTSWLRALGVLVVLASAAEAASQDALLLYHHGALPKRLLLNPAAEVDCRAWLSLPVVGHVDQTVQLPFSARDVLDLRGVGLVNQALGRTPQEWDDVGLNIPRAIERLTGIGRARITTRVNLLGAGMRTARGLLHFSLDQQADLYAASGPEALQLVYYGVPFAAQAGNLSVDGLTYDGHTRSTLAVGYQFDSRRYPKWTFGGSAKLIKMQAHVRLEEVDVTPVLDSAGVAAHYEGRNRLAGFADVYDGHTERGQLGIARGLVGGNYGFGVDLGVRFRASDHWTYSASVTDVGLVRLDYQTRAYAFRNTVRMDDRPPLSEVGPINLEAGNGELTSLSADQEVVPLDSDPYVQALPATVYLGGEYRLADGRHVGAVVRHSMRGARLQTAAAANFGMRPWPWLETSATVGWTDGAGVGVGFGASLQTKAVQVYLGSDNALGLVLAERARWVNVFAGVTLLLPERKPDLGLVKRQRGKRRCYRF